jgi:hypothetical protein
MLWGNYSVLNKTPGRWLGGNSTAHASGVGTAHVQTRSNWGGSGALRNHAINEYSTDAYELASMPGGYGGRGWMMPRTEGGISSHYAARGEGLFNALISAGRNLSGLFDGVSVFTGTGQLVVSGSGAFTGVAAFTGNVIAALAASGAFTGVGSFTGATTAKGFATGTFSGVASFTAIQYATGSMSGSFSPALTLEAAGFSGYLLDTEIVETGLTLRQALRLVTAATAGKISGGGTSTVTIRNAVADGVDRLVATVDSSGNRTAITYDLD